MCASNVLARRPEALHQLKEWGYLIERQECLDQCTRCGGCAFALVSGKFVFAPTVEEFLRLLR